MGYPKDPADYEWASNEQRAGYRDGLSGLRAFHSNCYYQQGYKRGRERLQQQEATAARAIALVNIVGVLQERRICVRVR